MNIYQLSETKLTKFMNYRKEKVDVDFKEMIQLPSQRAEKSYLRKSASVPTTPEEQERKLWLKLKKKSDRKKNKKRNKTMKNRLAFTINSGQLAPPEALQKLIIPSLPPTHPAVQPLPPPRPSPPPPVPELSKFVKPPTPKARPPPPSSLLTELCEFVKF